MEYYTKRFADIKPLYSKGFGLSSYVEGFLEEIFIDTLKFGGRNLIIELVYDEFGSKPFWKVIDERKIDISDEEIVDVGEFMLHSGIDIYKDLGIFALPIVLQKLENFEKHTYFLRWDFQRLEDIFKNIVFTFPANENDFLIRTKFYLATNEAGIRIKFLEEF